MRVTFVRQWFRSADDAYFADAIADAFATRGDYFGVSTNFRNTTGRIRDCFHLLRCRRDQRSDRVVVQRAGRYPSHECNSVRRRANHTAFCTLGCLEMARRQFPKPKVWVVVLVGGVHPALPWVATGRLRAISSLLG